MDLKELLKELFNYGLPTVLVFVGIYGIYRVSLWTKTNVVEPMVLSHLQLVRTLQVAITKQSEDTAESKRLSKEVRDAAAEATVTTVAKLDKIEKVLVSQTEVLKQAIDYQTMVVECKTEKEDSHERERERKRRESSED